METEWLIERVAADLSREEAEQLKRRFSAYSSVAEVECPLCKKYRKGSCERCFLSGSFLPLCGNLRFGGMKLGNILAMALKVCCGFKTEEPEFVLAWKELQIVVGRIASLSSGEGR